MLSDYDRSTLLWRNFAAMLRRKADESQKLASQIDGQQKAIAQAQTMIYQEIADMASTISKGQGG